MRGAAPPPPVCRPRPSRKLPHCAPSVRACSSASIQVALPCPLRPTLLPPSHPPQFKAWLERHGPFGAVVDGANVALYGQNFEKGGFNFGQIK